jgi:hypothetical protein
LATLYFDKYDLKIEIESALIFQLTETVISVESTYLYNIVYIDTNYYADSILASIGIWQIFATCSDIIAICNSIIKGLIYQTIYSFLEDF